VRQQRVMAVLALKKMQEDEVAAGGYVDHELEAAFEEIHGTVERGTDEKHFYNVPTLPKFQVVPQYSTPEELKRLLPKFMTREEEAVREEKELVKQFTANIKYNLRITAPGLNRLGRYKHPAKRYGRRHVIHHIACRFSPRHPPHSAPVLATSSTT